MSSAQRRSGGSTGPASGSGASSTPRRSERPCPGCQRRRPDDGCGPADEACLGTWEVRHEFGDHRRCDRFAWPCAVARQHPVIRAAAVAALARTGRALAVVCLACTDQDGPRVLATFGDDLWSAKGLRNSHARRHGLGMQEKKGIVYVVDTAAAFL